MTYEEILKLSYEDFLKFARDGLISYHSFIQYIIDTRGQHNIDKGKYFEGHHIIPKCLGGEGQVHKNRKYTKHENIIYLYAEEHFIAHKILAIENSNNKGLVLAWSMMTFPKGKTHRDFEINPKEYAQIKEFQAQILRQHNNFLGEDGHPWNYGKTNVYSEQTIAKMKAPRAGGWHMSTEAKCLISEAQKRRFTKHPEMFVAANKDSICITNGEINKYINKEDIIPTGWYKGQTKNSDNTNYVKSWTPIRREAQSKRVSGKNNPNYGNTKMCGGNNSTAIYIYNYLGKQYQCRKDLMSVLIQDFPKISESTIRAIMSGKYTKRISNKYQFIIDNLSWELKKNEN